MGYLLPLLLSLAGCGGDESRNVDWDGFSAALESRRGNIAVVYVWAPWSRESLEALPAVAELAREYEGASARFLAVGVDAVGFPDAFEFGPMSDFRLRVEPSEALARLEVQDPPAALIYAPGGSLLWRLTLDDPDREFSPVNLADAVDQALAETEGAR